MSYDSTAMNANPNNTQTPARHDDLPAQTDSMRSNASNARSSDGQYVGGGERPEPASLKPRFGLAAAGRVPDYAQDQPAHRELDEYAGDMPVPVSQTEYSDSAQRLRGGSGKYAEKGLDSAGVEPPTHKVHREDEPLPPPGSGPQADPDFGAIPAQDAPPVHRVHSESEPLPPPGANAFNGERPLGVQPVREGGVAIGGQEGLPEGKTSAVDKLVGKTQKVIGKATKNWEMHEKGELREAGGKKAAAGEARAPHD